MTVSNSLIRIIQLALCRQTWLEKVQASLETFRTPLKLQIMNKCPAISRITIERALADLLLFRKYNNRRWKIYEVCML